MPKRKLQGPCAAIGCGKPIETRGYCETHYYRLWKFGRLDRVYTGKKRNHPLYTLWFERKQDDILCNEWLPFEAFCVGIGEKPSPNHFLVRLSPGKYGPENFKWYEKLRRAPGEAKKDWWARKWASRHANNPSLERSRGLRRRFGLSIENYEHKFQAQNGVCAICNQAEIAQERKSDSRKRLAVDHCHTTGKIRDLLCWRCNQTLGQVKESIDLLQSMIAYLRKHQSPIGSLPLTTIATSSEPSNTHNPGISA